MDEGRITVRVIPRVHIEGCSLSRDDDAPERTRRKRGQLGHAHVPYAALTSPALWTRGPLGRSASCMPRLPKLVSGYGTEQLITCRESLEVPQQKQVHTMPHPSSKDTLPAHTGAQSDSPSPDKTRCNPILVQSLSKSVGAVAQARVF